MANLNEVEDRVIRRADGGEAASHRVGVGDKGTCAGDVECDTPGVEDTAYLGYDSVRQRIDDSDTVVEHAGDPDLASVGRDRDAGGEIAGGHAGNHLLGGDVN